MAEEWSDSKVFRKEFTLTSDKRQFNLCDNQRGKYRITFGIYYDDDSDDDYYNSYFRYQIDVNHVSLCKMGIKSISLMAGSVELANQSYDEPNLFIVGGGPQKETTLVRRDFSNSNPELLVTFAVEYRMSKKCPCAVCAEKEREHSALLTNLCSSFGKMFSSTECSDVVFKVENTEIPAHKLILSTRYEYFKVMFSAPMRESTTNEVKIEGVGADTFKNVLKFVYSGDLPEDFEDYATTYLPVAEQYGMMDLKYASSSALKRRLNVSNLLEYLDVGVRYRCPDLVKAALDFADKQPELPGNFFVDCAENLLDSCVDNPDRQFANVLKKALNPENVVEGLMLAHQFHCQELKDECFKKIREFKAQKKLDREAMEPVIKNVELLTELVWWSL